MGLTTPEAQASAIQTFQLLHDQGFAAPQMPSQLPLPPAFFPAASALHRRAVHQYLGPPLSNPPFPPIALSFRPPVPEHENPYCQQSFTSARCDPTLDSPCQIEGLIQERVRLMSAGGPDRGPDSLPRPGSIRAHSVNESAFSVAAAKRETRVTRHLYISLKNEINYLTCQQAGNGSSNEAKHLNRTSEVKGTTPKATLLSPLLV